IFGSTVSPCGLDLDGSANGVITSYTYDALDRVKTISQGSLAQRQFTYDGVGHLLSEVIPEMAGATTAYGYNSEGLLTTRTSLSANQAAGCLPNNCATSITTYGYDA